MPEATGVDPHLLRELNELTLPLIRALRRQAERAFEPLGLQPTKALVLELVRAGKVRPKELADLLDTVPPAISAMLAELEGRGLLRRESDPNDRRRVVLTLTDGGLAMLERVRDAWHAAESERLSVLDDRDLRELLRIYRKLAIGE